MERRGGAQNHMKAPRMGIQTYAQWWYRCENAAILLIEYLWGLLRFGLSVAFSLNVQEKDAGGG